MSITKTVPACVHCTRPLASKRTVRYSSGHRAHTYCVSFAPGNAARTAELLTLIDARRLAEVREAIQAKRDAAENVERTKKQVELSKTRKLTQRFARAAHEPSTHAPAARR